MKAKNNAEKIEFWRSHIAAKKSTGVRQYCQEHGLSKAQYYYWKEKLRVIEASPQLLAKFSNGAKPKQSTSSFARVLASETAGSRSLPHPIRVQMILFEVSNLSELHGFLLPAVLGSHYSCR